MTREEALKEIEDGKIKLVGAPLSFHQARLVFDEIWKTGKDTYICAYNLGFLWFEREKGKTAQ